MPVRLSSGRLVTALVPVNDTTANSYIGDRPLSDRAKLAQTTRGEAGTSLEYVTGVHAKLQELEVDDPAVEEFWSLVSELEDLTD
jgi:cation transport regulator ChaC